MHLIHLESLLSVVIYDKVVIKSIMCNSYLILWQEAVLNDYMVLRKLKTKIIIRKHH